MINSKEIHFIDVWPIDLLKPLMLCEASEHQVCFFYFLLFYGCRNKFQNVGVENISLKKIYTDSMF